ncbi:hypothetical protein BX616_010206 [Lobosporangium transversale]|nr:hypothetical protein BX616_010206 [Lobosporangium transversale]
MELTYTNNDLSKAKTNNLYAIIRGFISDCLQCPAIETVANGEGQLPCRSARFDWTNLYMVLLVASRLRAVSHLHFGAAVMLFGDNG